MGSGGAVLAAFGDSFEQDQVEIALVALLIACAVGMVLVLRTVQKASTRLGLLGLLFLVGIGLWWQREELQDCQGQCTCQVFGLDVEMSDVVGGRLICPD